MPIKIAIMSGPEDGAVVTLLQPKQGDGFIIGRRDDCDVILPYDSQISRQHAMILQKDGLWYLADLKSRNGTYLGKRKISDATLLQPDQMFRVGRTWMLVLPNERKD